MALNLFKVLQQAANRLKCTGTIRKVNENQTENVTEWKIEDFFKLPANFDDIYRSPEFVFAEASWRLVIYPNSTTFISFTDWIKHTGESYINVQLRKESVGLPTSIKPYFYLKPVDGKVDLEICPTSNETIESHCIYPSESKTEIYECTLLKRSEFLKRKSEFLHSGAITVVCRLKCSEPSGEASSAAAEKCSYCKMTLEADEDISSHQIKCPNKPIKCPDCGDAMALKDPLLLWCDHDCQGATTEDSAAAEKCSYCKMTLEADEDISSHQIKCMASEKLVHDLKAMMLTGNHSDTTIKVKGEEFRLHKNILSSRNSVFDSMFKSDMKEKTTGIVPIDDCEPEAFRSFIHFLYTGKVDKLTPENVCDLYVVADKYLEDLLKKQCLHLMMNTISEDSFCDYIILALRHDEKELFHKTIDYFNSKPKEIVRSVKWQTFVAEYPTQANELFIKALDVLVK